MKDPAAHFSAREERQLDRSYRSVQDRSARESDFLAVVNERILPFVEKDLTLRAVAFTAYVRERKRYLIDWPFKLYYPQLNEWVKQRALDVLTRLHFENGICFGWVYFRYSFTNVESGVPSFEIREMDLSQELAQFGSEFHQKCAGLAELFHYMSFDPRLLLPPGDLHLLVVSQCTSIRREPGAVTIVIQLKQPSVNVSAVARAVSTSVLPMIAGKLEGSISNELFLDQSLHSAVAAIMARNMSHNLGSHALRKLDADFIHGAGDPNVGIEKSEKVAAFLGYVQQRMDFVARMATDWPRWRQPMFFFRDLVRGFSGQTVLRQHLLADDGYGGKVHFSYHPETEDTDGASLVFKPAEQDVHNPEGDPDGPLPENDPLVAIPGGVVGAQAFYAFLENALRNAARHGRKRPDRLTAFLGIVEKDDAYEVTYGDDLSEDSSGEVRERVGDILVDPLIDESSGIVTESHWGIQEMKVCAQFLAYDGKPESQWEDRLNVAQDLTVHCSTGNYSVLGYRFPLAKAVLAAIVDVGSAADAPQREAADAWRALGVHFVPAAMGLDDTHLSRIHQLSPSLVLIRCSRDDRPTVDDWVKGKRERGQVPRRLLVTDGVQNIDASDKTGTEKWVLGLYKDWLVQFASQRNIRKLDMVIDHKTDTHASQKRQWNAIIDDASKKYCVLDDDMSLCLSFASARSDVPCFAIDSHASTLTSGDWDGRSGAKQRLRFWQSRGEQNRAAKEAIENPPSGFGGVLFLLQLLEACLLRILIIDERVAQHVFAPDGNGKVAIKNDKHEMENLCAAGVEVVPCFRFDGYASPLLPLLPQWKEFADADVGLYFDALASVKQVCTWSFSEGAIRPKVLQPQKMAEPHPFDIVVIHRTQVDALAERLGTSPDWTLEKLRRVATKVVITSGKGTLLPKDPVRSYPFIEFSVIDSYVIREMWKYGLCSALMAAS